MGPAGLADDHLLAGGDRDRALVHALHVGDCLLARTAFPERVAVGQQHVAGRRDPRVALEQVVRVDVAHGNARRHRLPDAFDVADQFVLAHVLAQQDLVAHRQDVDVPCPGQGNRAGDLALVDLAVGAEPGTHQGLHAQFVGDPRGDLVAVGAGEAAHPARVRPDDAEACADLRLVHQRAWRLPLEVRTEAQAVHAGMQGFRELPGKVREFLGRKRSRDRRRGGTARSPQDGNPRGGRGTQRGARGGSGFSANRRGRTGGDRRHSGHERRGDGWHDIGRRGPIPVRPVFAPRLKI